MCDDIRSRYGLPEDLSAERAAEALEEAARAIRLGDSHEADLIDVIRVQAASKYDPELMRKLSGEGALDKA
jgi:hypothetical protein